MQVVDQVGITPIQPPNPAAPERGRGAESNQEKAGGSSGEGWREVQDEGGGEKVEMGYDR